MKNIRILILLTLISCTLFYSCCNLSNKKKGNIKYVFYFIGDGMGINQVNTTEGYLAALDNKIGYEKLNMRQFPFQSFVSTYAQNSYITQSAAAGTALSTGTKTSLGTLGLSHDWQDTLKSIAEFAQDLGMKIGIVSSVSIDHATPAAFYAHQPYRKMFYEISINLANSNFDFFGGGGFKNPGNGDTSSLVLAENNGYKIINTKADFKNLTKDAGKTISINQTLDKDKAMPYVIDKAKNAISLAEYTNKAIEVLDNEKGFFLMVEGGKIDWACHSNDAATAIQEVLDFDKAIAEAVKFYNSHPDETIIIATADHETGGMQTTDYAAHLEKLQYQKISYSMFDQSVQEFYKNSSNNKHNLNDLLKIVKENFGLGRNDLGLELTSEELKSLKEIYTESINSKENKKILYNNYNNFVSKVIELLDKKAGITWSTDEHTSSSVPIFVLGDNRRIFNGPLDNTDIPKKIMEYIKK